LFNESNPLGPFQSYWNANMGAVHRDVAQFTSGRRDLAFGGIAFLNALCESFGYGLSGYILGYFPDPTRPSPYQWDIGVTAHELGHNCGTGHTQDYGIDTCQDPNTTPQRGTIMSYCSQTWSGGNALEDNYFHTIIQANMEPFINSVSCVVPDCNMNNIDDVIDIAGVTSLDTNANGIPDECEDCNGNGVLDPVDIAGATSQDLNNNTIPDDCEPDCNNNNVPDDRDITLGTSTDAYGNGVPDECEEDCNTNGISDYTEIQLNITLDIDRDTLLDSCQDCDSDSIVDLIELTGAHNVWIASGLTNSPISEFHATVGVLMNTSSGGTGSLVNQGQDLIISSNDKVLVSSGGDNRIMEFDLSGNYVGDFVSSGAGGLNFPTGLFLTGGKLLVSSRDTNRVIAYSAVNGSLIGDFISAGSGGLTGPFGITRGPDGHLYVTSSTNEVLTYDSSTGSFIGVFVDAANNGGLSQPRGLVFKPDGNLLVASYGTNEVLEFEQGTGNPLGKWAQVGTATVLNQASPWGIRIGPNGGVYVIRTGDAFGSAGAEADNRHNHFNSTNTSESHLTNAQIYEFDVRNGYFLRAYIAGNDFDLDFPTGFDFVPGFTLDCNFNLLQDSCDIASGFSLDADTSGVPDECEVDCNNNSIQDRLDIIPYGLSFDCNFNLNPDDCDIASMTSTDCNSNGVPDECEEDCNDNGIADECDITLGTSPDCTGNGIPDECEPDCNNNSTPDSCDILANTSNDCNLNEIPDECEPDCNTNGIADSCDIANNTSDDCNLDEVPDECQIGDPPSTQVYLISTSDLVNVPNDCGSGPYNCSSVIGFKWQDTQSSATISIDVTFNIGVDCHPPGTTYGIRLNGVDVNSIVTNTSHCFCSTPSDNLHTITMSAEHYVAGAQNLLEITGASDCVGFFQSGAIGGEYAKVTATLVGDCNNNGIPDDCDIADNTSTDCNANLLPDECEGVSCIGACCDGISCNNNVTDIDCDALGGVWHFDEICENVDCAGSCCTDTICLENVSLPDCLAQEGEWHGGEICANLLCNTKCERAEEMFCNDFVTFDNSNISNSANPAYTCGFGSGHDGTLWYKFVAQGDEARLQTCASVAQDSTFAVYEGSCGALTQVGCSEDDCGTSGWLGDQTVIGLTPGATYYTQISAWDATARGIYTLQLECSCGLIPAAPSLEPQFTKKSRYISFIPGNSGVQTALRVTLENVDGFSNFNGQKRWVGLPGQYQEGGAAEPTFWGASLQCEPFYFDWGAIDALHVYGDAVVPNSFYTVQAIAMDCDTNQEVLYSSGVNVPTALWGDIIAPFGSVENQGQPNIVDVLSIVNKWLGTGFPIKASAQLQPNVVNPGTGVSIEDVLAGVNAWLSAPYPLNGPSSCP